MSEDNKILAASEINIDFVLEKSYNKILRIKKLKIEKALEAWNEYISDFFKPEGEKNTKKCFLSNVFDALKSFSQKKQSSKIYIIYRAKSQSEKDELMKFNNGEEIENEILSKCSDNVKEHYYSVKGGFSFRIFSLIEHTFDISYQDHFNKVKKINQLALRAKEEGKQTILLTEEGFSLIS